MLLGGVGGRSSLSEEMDGWMERFWFEVEGMFVDRSERERERRGKLDLH